MLFSLLIKDQTTILSLVLKNYYSLTNHQNIPKPNTQLHKLYIRLPSSVAAISCSALRNRNHPHTHSKRLHDKQFQTCASSQHHISFLQWEIHSQQVTAMSRLIQTCFVHMKTYCAQVLFKDADSKST